MLNPSYRILSLENGNRKNFMDPFFIIAGLVSSIFFGLMVRPERPERREKRIKDRMV